MRETKKKLMEDILAGRGVINIQCNWILMIVDDPLSSYLNMSFLLSDVQRPIIRREKRELKYWPVSKRE